MDVQQFEQAILKLAFETDARITTASVAYYLGIPSREANQLLNQLLEEGVLELDSDPEGNLFYCVPNKAASTSRRKSLNLTDSKSPTSKNEAPSQPDSDPLSSTLQLVSADDDDLDVTPVSPILLPRPDTTHQSVRQQSGSEESYDGFHMPEAATKAAMKPHKAGLHRKEGAPETRHRFHDPKAWQRASGHAIKNTNHAKQPTHRSHSVFGAAARRAAPDASLNRCGASPVIVSNTARCEPRPLADSKPVVTSCVEYPNTTTWQTNHSRDHYGFGYVASGPSTALVASQHGDLSMASDSLQHIEQPEHQPGMALLLSLILCGTGQIYNGEVSKGIVMMVLCFLLWFVLLGWVVHIWSIVDSVVVAERINRKPNQNA